MQVWAAAAETPQSVLVQLKETHGLSRRWPAPL